jgi:cytochrome P450/NADPH-cytochrome P450 reductase
MFIYLANTALSLFWLLRIVNKSGLKQIPEPKGIALLGNVLQLDMNRPYLQQFQWLKAHGNVYKLNLTGSPIVVVNGEKCIYEVCREAACV